MRRWRDGRPRGGGRWPRRRPRRPSRGRGRGRRAGRRGAGGGGGHHDAGGGRRWGARAPQRGRARDGGGDPGALGAGAAGRPPQSGRTHLAWGHASYGAGTEDFGWRVRVEARRRGAPWPCWATGPSGSGGAPGTAVVEIVDIVRAYGYLRDVAAAVGGAGTAAASAWVEPPKDRLYQQGAAPVLAALAALSPLPAAAAEAHHDALSYFTANATRMDYPRARCPSARGRWRAPASAWSRRGPRRPGCVGPRPASSASPACAPCTARGARAAFWQSQPRRQRAAGAPRPRPLAPPSAPPSRRAPVSAPRPKPTARQRPLLLPRSAYVNFVEAHP